MGVVRRGEVPPVGACADGPQPALERFGEQYWEIMVSYSAFLVKYLNGNKMMREKAEMQKRLAWEEAMRERCRNNEADSHSGE